MHERNDHRTLDAGLREAMRMVIDEFTLTYPGIKNVEREYFYAVHGADDATRRGLLGEEQRSHGSSSRTSPAARSSAATIRSTS